MTEREPIAELLLGRARAGHEPSAADEERVRALLHARILGTPLLLSPTKAPVTGAVKLTLGKAVVGLALCAIGFATVVALTRQTPSRVQPTSHGLNTPTPARPAPSAQLAPNPLTNSEASRAAAPEPEKVDPVALPARLPISPRRAASAAPSAVGPDSLQLELSGLRNAQRQLHAGSPAQAVVTLDNLSREVPVGVLTEDREATRVIALCSLGVNGATAFVTRFPGSVHAARVRSACSSVVGK